MMMLAFSAKNTMDESAMYSVHTYSNSLSANQMVFVRIEITHIMARGQSGEVNHRCSCVLISTESVK